MSERWFWAASSDGPARARFIIANGQPELWRRFRAEIDPHEQHRVWDAIHAEGVEPTVGHVLELLLIVAPRYRVDHNRFVLEAAQIPAFAKLLSDSPNGVADFVSNSAHPEELIPLEPYSEDAARRLARVVKATITGA